MTIYQEAREDSFLTLKQEKSWPKFWSNHDSLYMKLIVIGARGGGAVPFICLGLVITKLSEQR